MLSWKGQRRWLCCITANSKDFHLAVFFSTQAHTVQTYTNTPTVQMWHPWNVILVIKHYSPVISFGIIYKDQRAKQQYCRQIASCCLCVHAPKLVYLCVLIHMWPGRSTCHMPVTQSTGVAIRKGPTRINQHGPWAQQWGKVWEWQKKKKKVHKHTHQVRLPTR